MVEALRLEILAEDGGGGAGAGIGGNGGNGGQANTTFSFYKNNVGKSIIGYDENSGKDGEKGEDCGTIYINDSLTIYAYGGAGGYGGVDTTRNSGSGAGGYPAAGIGGGGAGGRWWRSCLSSRRIYLW